MSTENQTFAEKLDLFGCIQCGRCTGGCPVTVRTNLNVRRFVYDAKNEEMLEELSKLAEIWDCTACHTCAVRCPKGLKPLEVLFGLRTLVVESGKTQPTVRDALESVFREGNPWEKPRATRYDWMEGLEVKIADPEQPVENLFFVCCTIAYDPRVQIVAKNLVKILNQAGVDYGFIGENESCCGSEVFALGEEGLFEMTVEDNTEFLNEFQARQLVTLSPHCFTTFRTRYPDLNKPVLHYTQLLDQLLQEGKISWNQDLPKKIVFHDPCYLGKQSLVFDEPRRLLKSIQGVELLEFDRSRERSLCCEGGGGKMWVESESKAQRLAETRIKDAKEMGAEIVAVACPFCVLTLEDAMKALGYEEEMRVAEITELLGELLA
ncbi:MAG TPA: (Fe-S)-binding protein [Bacillota bacterium]|nr:(Fe-S)-binding protein [Bacillota bacterium]HOB87506.1 (Fe-S)-binding protein [Bacillota bacterium]HOP68491.1 (Fe-S)-binding protein [Bacillota bacterium]HPT33280.1 (Fe-S)-binding protein [Bacillota bacterium]HQD06011.1 (Fe-S)-binding protein [Bacillota bacterium]